MPQRIDEPRAGGALPSGEGLTVLIDTTLQIEQQKIEPRPEVIRKAVSGFTFRAASTYSRLEAKRSWIQRLAYIHTESKHVATIPQLLDRINSKLGSNLHHHRKLTTAVEAISACMAKLKGNLSDKAQMERLRYVVVDAILSLNTWWDRSVHHEFDGSKCIRARERPTFDTRSETVKAGVARCLPSKIQCDIHNFAVQNMVYFDKVIDAVNNARHEAEKSEELKAAAGVLAKAKEKPERLCDDNICRKVGDCLIAVDGIGMCHFASTNDREWIPLSKIFEKHHVNPRSSRS